MLRDPLEVFKERNKNLRIEVRPERKWLRKAIRTKVGNWPMSWKA